MRVNIRRCVHVGVTEPILYHLHWYFVCEEHGGTGVPEVMQSNFLESVSFEYHLEMRCCILRFDNIADCIHADIFDVLSVVRTSEDSLHFFLPFLFFEQDFLDKRYKGE